MEVRGDKKDFVHAYQNLSKGPIKNKINEIMQLLKNDSIVGDHVKHEQIPNYYKLRHNVQVLYRVALPQHWRLVYTFQTFVKGEKPKVLLLELMDHDTYNKRFGYFKKKSS
ncbi:MAG: hypothetical protein ACT4N5_06385 [Nitrosopumilaceae archaeon]